MKFLVFVLIIFVTFFCVGAFSLQQQQQHLIEEEGDVIVEEGNDQINKHIRNKRFLFGNDQSSGSGYSNYGAGNSGYGGGYNGYNGGGAGYSSGDGYSGNGLGYSNFGSGLPHYGGGYTGYSGGGYGNVGGVDGYYGENLNYFPYGTRTYPIRGFRIIRNSYGERLAYPYY